MLNSCRKFVWMKICYWKFEGNLNIHVPLWAQQHMVDRHYSLNLKPWSARTLYACLCTCRFSTKIFRWSTGHFCLQVVLEGRKFFIPALLLTLCYCNNYKPGKLSCSAWLYRCARKLVLVELWFFVPFCLKLVSMQTVFLPRPSNLPS
jgi:hypothetical protein